MKALLFTSALALAAQGVHADEIRVLNWQGYGTDIDWSIAEFAKATGNTVVHEYFTSDEELLTKLRTNPGAYDVVVVNSSITGRAFKEGLIGEIDTSKIPNVADVDPSFLKNDDLNPGGAMHGVPWVWGLTSLAINTNDFPDAPQSLSVLWDPAWKGKVSIRDDGLEAVQLGALMTGQNINDVKDLPAIKAKLVELMPQITTYWSSESDWNQFMSAGDFAVATYWSGSASRSISKGLPISFVVPKEGAIGWIDGLSVPSASTHQDAAYAFINWMIDPAFYRRWSEEGAPASVNVKASAGLPEDSFNRKVLGDPEVVARVQFTKPVSDEVRAEYLALWQELKAAQ